MRSVDTNVLVRLLAHDDAGQTRAAEAFLAEEGHAWVSHLVLVETVWVLESVFGRGRKELAAAIETLLDHQELFVQEPDVVRSALVIQLMKLS